MYQVQAGAGGTESMDWAAMVMRMYRMWAHNRGFQVTEVDEMAGEEAGIKVFFFSFMIFFCSISFVVVFLVEKKRPLARLLLLPKPQVHLNTHDVTACNNQTGW
jgi:hypothetical protein